MIEIKLHSLARNRAKTYTVLGQVTGQQCCTVGSKMMAISQAALPKCCKYQMCCWQFITTPCNNCHSSERASPNVYPRNPFECYGLLWSGKRKRYSSPAWRSAEALSSTLLSYNIHNYNNINLCCCQTPCNTVFIVQYSRHPEVCRCLLSDLQSMIKQSKHIFPQRTIYYIPAEALSLH